MPIVCIGAATVLFAGYSSKAICFFIVAHLSNKAAQDNLSLTHCKKTWT